MIRGRGPGTFAYHLYGIRLLSQWELSFPVSRATETPLADVELVEGSAVLFAQVRSGPSVAGNAGAWYQHYYLGDGSTYLFWPGLFEFLVSADGRIACRPLKRLPGKLFRPTSSVIPYPLPSSSLALSRCTPPRS